MAVAALLNFLDQVPQAYNSFYKYMTDKFEEPTSISSLKRIFDEETKRLANAAINRNPDAPLNVQLFAALYLLVFCKPEEQPKVFNGRETPWKLIHMTCFLTSPEGRLFVSGLHCHKVPEHRFTRMSDLVQRFLKEIIADVVSQSGNEPVAAELLVNVVLAAALTGNMTFITHLRSLGLPQQGNEIFYNSIERILSNSAKRPRNYGMFNMQPPEGDVTKLTFRLLTFLKYPPEAGVQGDQLARLGFISTCWKDKICCIWCNYESVDLTANCDPTSGSFHFSGCLNSRETRINETRLAYRLSTFLDIPWVDGRNFALWGLFCLGDGYHMQCYRCHQITNMTSVTPANIANCHLDLCPISRTPLTIELSANQRMILSQIPCCECRVAPANVMCFLCCHLVSCDTCFESLPSPYTHCPRCQVPAQCFRKLYQRL